MDNGVGAGVVGPGGYLAASPTDSTGIGNAWTTAAFNDAPRRAYFLIVVNSSTDVDLWYSANGRIWFKVKGALDPGVTIGSVGICINPGSTGASRVTASAYAFLRIWNSVLTPPGV